MESMNIGQAATASGVAAKIIRHYEEIGLVRAPRRTASNYRTSSASDVHTLRFVKLDERPECPILDDLAR